MKIKILLTVIAIMTLGYSMPVCAQPKTMSDGTAFDAEYYANRYSDVKAVFGNDEAALYNHYVQYGKSEGRAPVASSTLPDKTVFDAEFYANTYPDVKAAFGNDEAALYDHYVHHGKSEGRLSHSYCGVGGCTISGEHTHGHSNNYNESNEYHDSNEYHESNEYHDSNEYHESNDHNDSNKHNSSNKHNDSGHGGKHH